MGGGDILVNDLRKFLKDWDFLIWFLLDYLVVLL
jgi:hypothetical protein